MKRLANRKGGEQNSSSGKKAGTPLLSPRQKKGNSAYKNNPYPASGYAPRASPRSSADGQLSFAVSSQNPNTDGESVNSNAVNDREGQAQSNRSTAPTVMTNAETLYSDAGYSKAATTTTRGGAVSSTDGAGGGSTFSSPSQSERSLTTTLTTIHSMSAANALHQNGTSGNVSQHQHNSQLPVMFSHQYPVSPTQSNLTASAIPRHVSEAHGAAGNSLTDNASIMTLASSSKRRRRSMDTDASVRALAPSSVWGGSRESLPLSVLSGNADTGSGFHASSRPSISGLATAERASVYSSQGVTSPTIASDRNSYYAGAQKKDLTADAKSLRSLNNLDARSQYDAKSINDARSMDVSSIKGYEGSVRSGAVGHGRQDSIPGSIGAPLAHRHPTSGGLSRQNSDWAGATGKDGETAGEDETNEQQL